MKRLLPAIGVASLTVTLHAQSATPCQLGIRRVGTAPGRVGTVRKILKK
jgi:hypothetical protein